MVTNIAVFGSVGSSFMKLRTQYFSGQDNFVDIDTECKIILISVDIWGGGQYCLLNSQLEVNFTIIKHGNIKNELKTTKM